MFESRSSYNFWLIGIVNTADLFAFLSMMQQGISDSCQPFTALAASLGINATNVNLIQLASELNSLVIMLPTVLKAAAIAMSLANFGDDYFKLKKAAVLW